MRPTNIQFSINFLSAGPGPSVDAQSGQSQWSHACAALAVRVVVSIVLLLGFTTINVCAQDLPGAAQTSYGVSDSGAFQYQIPIVIPQGIAGVQPNLGLSFSSARGNGPLGVGWGLTGLGAITRCGRTIATDGVKGGVLHDENDQLCLNGKRLILVSGAYGQDLSEYRTEIDEFSKVTAHGTNTSSINGGNVPDYFIVYRKDGSRYYYGPGDNSRFFLPGTSSVHAWKLTRMYDRNGNYYRVVYSAADRLPEYIEYTMRSGLSPQMKIDFIYQTRPDTRQRYIVGRLMSSTRRMSSIKVTNGGTTVREYKLNYQTAPVSNRSRLTSITECGLNNECMPPIRLSWQTDTKGYQPTTATPDKAPYDMIEYYTFTRYREGVAPAPGSVKEINRGAWVDVNGDGRVDQVIAYTAPSGTTVYRTYLNTATGWSESSNWRLRQPLRSYQNSIVNNSVGRFGPDVINMGLFSDVNGDGLVDIVYSYRLDKERHQYADPNNPLSDIEDVRETWINNGNGWELDTAWKPKDLIYDYISNGAGNYRVQTVRGRLIDLNGDGLVDWVRAYFDYTSNNTGNSYKNTWINNGNGWSHDAGYAMPDVFSHYRGIYSIPHGQFVDVNGDGLPDWVQAYHASTEAAKIQTWINDGTQFSADSQFNAPELIYDNLAGWNDVTPRTRGSFIDVNGDGLRDWVKSYVDNHGGEYRGTYLNNGNGWTYSAAYKPLFSHIDHRYSDFERGWPVNVRGHYVDLNRDGLVDYVEAYRSSATNFPVYKQAWLNNGNGWDKQTGSGNPYVPTEIYYDYSGRDNAKARYGSFVDINSDGSPDWVKARAGVARSTNLHRVGSVDRIASITSTAGVEVRPVFLPLTADTPPYTKGTGAAETDSFHIQRPIYVTSQLQTSRPDGAGYNTNYYHYKGAQVNRLGRGFLGFSERSITNAQAGLVETHVFRQDYPYIGMAAWVGVSEQSNGNVISITGSTPASRLISQSNGAKTTFVYLNNRTTTRSELNSNGGADYQTVYRSFSYDDFGNVTQSFEQHMDHQGAIQGQVWVNHAYTPNTASWLISLPDYQVNTYRAPGEDQIRLHNGYTYDSRGRLVTDAREPNISVAGINVTTRFSYDTYGNVVGVTRSAPGETSRSSSITYDTQHRLLVSTANPLNQAASVTYHPQCDQPQTVTDINGAVTRFEYDNFCRQTRQTVLGDVDTTTRYNVPGLSCSGICQVTPAFSVTTQTDGQTPVTAFYNRYGQNLAGTTTGMLGEAIRQRTEYDRLGRVARDSQPFFSSDAGSEPYTAYQYDKLNRPIRTTLPFLNNSGTAATVVNAYSVNSSGQTTVTTTDTKGRATRSFANSLGQIVRIKDAYDNSLHYYFDAQGNLTQTTDAAGNSITVGYDRIGRRIFLDDPDMGLTSYVYNAFDEVTGETNANGHTISMAYDPLGRIVSRTVPGLEANGGGTSTWTYDGSGQVGLLSSVTGPNGYSKTYSYDQYSRPIGDTTTIKGEAYVQSYSYDINGRLASRYYPDSGAGHPFGVAYNYTNGYLASITSDDVNCIEHWRADRYDALGRTQQDTLGRLVSTTRSYKPGQGVLERIESIVKLGPQTGTTVQDLNYSYDAANNLTSRNDGYSGLVETFSYDSLDRLVQHRRDTQVTDVSYDAIGNITYKSDVGYYSYGNGAGPHAVTRVDLPIGSGIDLRQFEVPWEWNNLTQIQTLPDIHGQNFQYDARGNIQQSGDRWISWTAFDKPHRMERVGAGVVVTAASNFEYGPEFNRIYKSKDTGLGTPVTESTVYIGKDYERITDAGGTIHRYTIATGGNTIQIERDDNSSLDKPKYLLGDHLGSTNIILDAMGEVEQTLAFDPWGARLNTGDTTAVNSITNRGYTSHEMDDEIGMINMNARIYDPYLGRFLSADPVLPDSYDLQAFNRYSYVYNNPLKYVDPTGNVPGVHGGNVDVGDEPNNCSPGAGCIRPAGTEYVDPYAESLDPDEIANNIFGNTFIQVYGDETGYQEQWRDNRYRENAGELNDLLNDPNTSLEILQNAYAFLQEHGRANGHYNGLEQKFADEINRRINGGSSGITGGTQGGGTSGNAGQNNSSDSRGSNNQSGASSGGGRSSGYSGYPGTPPSYTHHNPATWGTLSPSTVDAVAGFGDSLSFNITKHYRNWRNIGSVDTKSNSYGFGHTAGLAFGLANAGRTGLKVHSALNKAKQWRTNSVTSRRTRAKRIAAAGSYRPSITDAMLTLIGGSGVNSYVSLLSSDD